MSELKEGTVKTFFDYLRLTLRYVSAGFVSLIVLMLIDAQFLSYWAERMEKSAWVIVFIAATIGVLIYALHHALFDAFYYNLSIWLYEKYYHVGKVVEHNVEEWDGNNRKTVLRIFNIFRWKRAERFALIGQTYLRKSSKDPSVVAMQDYVEDKLALLMFLYGSFYSTFFISSFYWLYLHKIIHPFLITLAPYKINENAVIYIWIISIFILVIALIFDYTITKREMWLVQYYPQFIATNVIIEFKKNDADYIKSVSVAGNFSGWSQIALIKKDGLWSVEVECADPTIEYKFIVNGQWETGPNYSKQLKQAISPDTIVLTH